MTLKLLSIAVVMGLVTGAGCTCRLGGSEQTEPPAISSVDPSLGNNAQDIRATVIGTGFVPLLVRDLDDETGYRTDDTFRVTVGGLEARDVARVDSEHLLITIPAGLPEGPHDVTVTSPAGQVASKPQAYYATSAEAPLLSDISPQAAVNDAAQPIAVSGTGFRAGAQMFAAPGSLPVVDLLTATPLADDLTTTPTATLKTVIVPAGLQPGPYTLAVRNPDGQRAHLQDVLRVVSPASLSLSLTAPARVSVGQAFSVTAAIDNSGGSAANQVTLDPPATPGTGTVTLGAPTPATATVQAGTSATLTLPALATQEGTLTVSTRATGQNEFSLRAVATASAATQPILIQRPAALTASISTVPAAASVGQTVTVTVQVQNTGEADAVGVAPSALLLSGSGGATLASGPSPASATIAGGTSASFTFTYTASAPGTVVFTGTAQGRDGNSMQVVTSAAASSSPITVQTAAVLSITIFSLPVTVTRGQTFTATMVVANTGQAAALGVLPVPSPPLQTVTGGAGASTSTALTPVNIPGGGSATFSWIYLENGTGSGTLRLRAGAAGTDASSGSMVSAAAIDSNVCTVQSPGTLQVTSFTLPATLTRGQTFTASMTVRNTGTLVVNNVLPSPNPPLQSSTGGAAASTSTSLAPVNNLGPGASTTFTWTFVENGTGPGTLTFTAGASGVDANMTPVSANATSTNLAQVQTAPSLTVTSLTLPLQLSRGQAFQAVVVVSNSGQATAINVRPNPDPPTKILTGGADATNPPAAMTATIPGGGSATFTYSYTESGAAPGTISLRAGAQGQDANSTGPVNAPQVTSNVAAVGTPAALSITSFTVPAVISRGQIFALRMTVQNTGQATANAVLPIPNPPTPVPSGGAAATTSTMPSPVAIPGGSSATFVYTCTENGTGPGTLAFTGAAQGTDANSGATVTSPSSTSSTVTVQSPPSLAVTFSVPQRISYLQSFNAVVTVTNSGQAAANGVVPSPNPPGVNRTAQARASSSTVASPVTIPGGSSAMFTYSYTETGGGTGTLALTAGATGTDANTGGAVSGPSSTSSTITVQSPASLTVTSLTVPPRLSRGQNFTGTMTVSNSGQADAVTVLPQPSSPTLVLTGGANATTSTSQTAVTIPGGGSRSFSWTFLENGTGSGTLALQGGAAGNDANSGAAVTALPITSAAAPVESPAQLSVTSFTIPPGLNRGQAFQAVMVVTNNGQGAATGVLPSPNPPTIASTGGANATTPTALTPATIAGGASTTFTWLYTENGGSPGTIQLTAGATGTDANSGTTITAASASTVVCNVQTPAVLTSSIAGPPAAVSGDLFAVTMTVNNTGGATANNVTPSALMTTITGTVSPSVVSSPPSASIPGGTSAIFTWTYSTTLASNGTVRFTGNAAGTDANTGAAVTSPSSMSNIITVIPPATAGLVSAITTRPRSIPVGDTVVVEMSVNNRTTGTINGVTPSSLTVAGTGQVVLVSGPTPATFNLLASETRFFSWTYRATAAGWVTFTGNAVSTTPANASARTTSPALAIPSPGCHLSTLVVNAGVDRTITCNGTAGMGGTPTATGGNPSYVYEWTPTANVSNPAVANPTASPRTSGVVYTVKVTDGDGCQQSDSMVVTVSNAPTQPVITSGQVEDRRCTGNSFNLTRNAITCSGTCSHLWDHGDSTTSNTNNTSHTKSYATAGTYIVRYTVTDSNMCQATAALPVFVGSGTATPIGRMTLTPSAGSVAADGSSTITFSSQALRDCAGNLAVAGSGMRFLVMTDRGTITNGDVDGASAGIQVNQSGVAGGFGVSFIVRADRVGGPVRVRAQSVLQAGSNARGWATAAFTGSTSLPQVVAAASEGLTAVNPSRVGAAFNKAMSAATVTGTNVLLQEIGGGTCAAPTGPAVAGTTSYLPATRAASFAPSAALDVLTRAYVMRLTAGLQDTFAPSNPLDGNLNGTANGSPQDDYRFCFGDLPDTAVPTISCTSLLPAALSPDGDGTSDNSTMTVSLGDNVGLKSWRVEVRHELTGALVRTLSKLRTTPGTDTLQWDGRNDSGQVVPNGSYQLSATALDSSDNRSAPCSLGLTVSSVLDSPELSPP